MSERAPRKSLRFGGSLPGVATLGEFNDDAQMLAAGVLDVLTDDLRAGVEINAFLSGSLDECAMIAAVSPKLYRQRKQQGRAWTRTP